MTNVDQNEDDIALSAYIDGELPDADVHKLQERLAREPELARRLEMLRGSDSDALRLYSAIDERPMPQAVLDVLEQGSAADDDDDNVIVFPKRGIQQFFQMPVAIAASVALLAGFLVGDIFREANQAGPVVTNLYAGQVETGSNLHQFLEQGISAQSANLAEGVSAELLLTFQDRSGDFCRQLRVDGAVAPVQGLACRRGNTWAVEAVGIAAEKAPDGSYQLASGETPAAIESAIDELIGSLPPLDSEEEKAIISSGWKKLGN